MSNVDGLVVDETQQGIRERVEYVLKGLGVYEKRNGSLRWIGYVVDDIAYEHRPGKLPRCLGNVIDLE